MEIFTFGLGEEVKETSKEVLGGKGAGLTQMSKLGISVPPGFILPTTVWTEYNHSPKTTMKEIRKEVKSYLLMLRNHFGYDPLLSVRSGARVSLPGLMDTILNVGLDKDSNKFWIEKLGNECWVNSYHRLVTMYGSVAKGVERQWLEEAPGATAAIVRYEEKVGEAFPSAFDQLIGSIEAVFKSWNNERAKVYRKLHSIPEEWGTAVVVQSMVFGNLNDKSGTGVLFTRNPDTGERKVTGEFLPLAQGEEIVAGIRTPMPLSKMSEWNANVAIELHEIVEKLEKENKDMQDVEFTVQDGKLYLLQTRNGKRSAQSAIRIAVEMVEEGMLTPQEAVKRVSAKQLDLAQIPVIDPKFTKKHSFQGIPACSGVVSGKPVFSAKDAINCKEPCILITKETTPDDISGMLAAVGVVTLEGGATSHAAVISRGENKPCVVGVGGDISVFKNASVVSMDGSTGRIWLEKVPVVDSISSGHVNEFKKMVNTAYGLVPVITSIPEQEMEQALLHVGVNMLTPSKAAHLIVSSAVRVKKLYIDLTTSTDAEVSFYSICESMNSVDATMDEVDKIYCSFKPEGQKEFSSRVIFISKKDSGYNSLKPCTDLKDLITAKGEITLSLEMDEATKWVLDHKIAEGLQVVSIGSYKNGLKSLVSLEQVLSEVA